MIVGFPSALLWVPMKWINPIEEPGDRCDACADRSLL